MLLGKHKLTELCMEGTCVMCITCARMHVTLHTGNEFSKAGLEQHMAPVLSSLGALEIYQLVCCDVM